MNIKSLLLGSAAALVAVSGARAADAIVAAEPEPVEYVRVCDAFGTGYFYIPGTETCLRIGGYVQYDAFGGELHAATSNTGEETYFKRTRVSFQVSTASETELGTLRTYVESRWNFTTGNVTNAVVASGPNALGVRNGYETFNDFVLEHGWVELGGLRIGKSHSTFTTFTGYAGNVINDDIAGGYGPFGTNFLSYTYTGGAWRAMVAFEQGDDSLLTTNRVNVLTGALLPNTSAGWGIEDYVPHVVGGIGATFGMVDLSAVVGWDSRDTIGTGGFAGKVRANVTINDAASVFAMLLYGENESAYTTWRRGAATDETFSVIAGGSYAFNEKATFNIQGQWIDGNAANDAWSLVANVAYAVVPGLVVTPEVTYLDNGTNDMLGAGIRIRRSF